MMMMIRNGREGKGEFVKRKQRKKRGENRGGREKQGKPWKGGFSERKMEFLK